MIAPLPQPPYTAVIFSNTRTDGDHGYQAMGQRMQELARSQPGYLGYESARDESGFGITISYWTDDEAARSWKRVQEHTIAQDRGRQVWYSDYQVRVATVNRSYGPKGN